MACHCVSFYKTDTVFVKMAQVEYKWVIVEQAMHESEAPFVMARSSDRYSSVLAAMKAGKKFLKTPANLDFDTPDSSRLDLDFEKYTVSDFGQTSPENYL